MKRQSLLTPREMADAIGVSESALRRWVDAGDIRMSRTTGGHRRIPVQEAIRFIRASGATIVRPEMLGLENLTDAVEKSSAGEMSDRLFSALKAGDRAVARGLILSSYMEGMSLPALFDGPLRDAMNRVGELWAHDARGIMVEHRATEICLNTLAELRTLVPAADEQAPLAIGGAPQDDPYQVPSTMAAAVLNDVGLRDVNFGANTPLQLLGHEAIQQGARLVWVSVSAEREMVLLRVAVKKLAGVLAKNQIDLVIGGRFAASCAPRATKHVHLIHSMSELAAFGRGLLTARVSAPT